MKDRQTVLAHVSSTTLTMLGPSSSLTALLFSLLLTLTYCNESPRHDPLAVSEGIKARLAEACAKYGYERLGQMITPVFNEEHKLAYCKYAKASDVQSRKDLLARKRLIPTPLLWISFSELRVWLFHLFQSASSTILSHFLTLSTAFTEEEKYSLRHQYGQTVPFSKIHQWIWYAFVPATTMPYTMQRRHTWDSSTTQLLRAMYFSPTFCRRTTSSHLPWLDIRSRGTYVDNYCMFPQNLEYKNVYFQTTYSIGFKST